MKITNLLFSILGAVLLVLVIRIGLKINSHYNTTVYIKDPIIKHDPKDIFEFGNAETGWQNYIGGIKGINFHWNKKDYSDLNFNEFLEHHTKTSAFIIIRKDSILYERYFDDYGESTSFPSYSISKSFVSALLGVLIKEEVIANVQDPVTKYIKELKGRGSYWNELTIEHLLNMESGLEFVEDEEIRLPYFGLAQLYLSNDVMKVIKRAKFSAEPGAKDSYSSLDNQILGIVLERATGKGLAQLMEEKIWTKIGMQADARWSYDSKKHKNIRSYCCMKATALDYARFGRLYLNDGNWNGEQIVPVGWVEHTVNRTRETGYYNYQWFLGRRNVFYAQGLFGQFVYVNPKTETIFIRLGKKDDLNSKKVFYEIEKKLEYYYIFRNKDTA